jgi:hypothetical protein
MERKKPTWHGRRIRRMPLVVRHGGDVRSGGDLGRLRASAEDITSGFSAAFEPMPL